MVILPPRSMTKWKDLESCQLMKCWPKLALRLDNSRKYSQMGAKSHILLKRWVLFRPIHFQLTIFSCLCSEFLLFLNFVFKFHSKEEESEIEVTEYEITTTTTKTVIESGGGPSTQVIKKSSTSSTGGPSAQIVKTSGGGAAEITVNLHYFLYRLFSMYVLYVFIRYYI